MNNFPNQNPLVSKGMALTTLLCMSLFVVGCNADIQRSLEALISDAEGVVVSLNGKPDTVLVNGEPDLAYAVYFTIENVGKRGIINISPWLSSLEGEWARTQKLTFSPGEKMRLKYVFHEPSINASNIQYGVKVYPKPNTKKS